MRAEENRLAQPGVELSKGLLNLYCMRAEEYWLAQPGVETRIRASDHLFYPRQHLPRLEAAIRRLHALVCCTSFCPRLPMHSCAAWVPCAALQPDASPCRSVPAEP